MANDDELYRAVVQNVADGIAITVRTKRVFVNPAYLRIHGLRDESEVVGHPLDRFIFPDDRAAVTERILARQRGEQRDGMVEYRIQRPDGEVRTVQASVVATSYGGRPAAMSVIRDITEIKNAELEILRLNKELEEKVFELRNANVELEAFNSTVSHDLRTPLMVIKGFSQRIMKKYGGSQEEGFRNGIEIIHASALKMEMLIDDLLAFSRLGKKALKRIPIAMEELVGSVLQELQSIYPGGDITIEKLAPSFGDEHMVRQVFANLLSNALKFSAKKEKRAVRIGCIEMARENTYFVRDNGAGFDMEQKDRLFNVFQRLHNQEEFSGTGMGLAIVKRIIGLHGGRVWAEGEPDRGATFYVTLPRVPEARE